MGPKRLRNAFISLFAAAWLVVFQYESLRFHYLDPLFGRHLPKVKFLYPPAGWIMFYRVDEYEVRVEVYAQKGEAFERLDPHRIFETRWLGYDNIRRNVLVNTLRDDGDFCRYLKRKFPSYNSFTVAQVLYADRPATRNKAVERRAAYRC